MTFGAVIAAGGRGKRLGERQKALLSMGDGVVLERLVAAYTAAKCAPIVVVAFGATVDAARALGCTVIESDPDAHMIDSLARGVAMLPASVGGAIIQPVDAPFTTREMISALLLGGGDRPRILCHRSVPGHPVLVPARLFPSIGLRPDGGLRAILADAEVELVEWDDDRVLADVDTPEDLVRWGLGEHGWS